MIILTGKLNPIIILIGVRNNIINITGALNTIRNQHEKTLTVLAKVNSEITQN